MEQCVPAELYSEAVELFHSERFFRDLPPMAGAIDALRAMRASGRYRCILCTSPILTSRHCAQDKYDWVREHLGEEWLTDMVLTADKTSVRGDVLIDDKPVITGGANPVWEQVGALLLLLFFSSSLLPLRFARHN